MEKNYDDLIATFMGHKISHVNSVGVYLLPESLNEEPYLCRYQKSWDWLMPVIEKIENTKKVNHYYSEISILNGTNVSIFVRDYRNGSMIFQWYGCLDKNLSSKHQAIYKAVVKYIKWYNENIKWYENGN